MHARRSPDRSTLSPRAATGRVLDLRGLPAPAPMIQALDAAGALEAGESLDVITPLMPYPLLQALAEQGFEVAAEHRGGDGGARVTVRRPAHDAARP
jgi:TusA-related sulfurtransferase